MYDVMSDFERQMPWFVFEDDIRRSIINNCEPRWHAYMLLSARYCNNMGTQMMCLFGPSLALRMDTLHEHLLTNDHQSVLENARIALEEYICHWHPLTQRHGSISESPNF